MSRTIDLTVARGAAPRALKLDALGGAAIRTAPSGELGAMLDLEGPENRPPALGPHAGEPERLGVRVLLAAGQVDELIAELVGIRDSLRRAGA